MLPGFLGIGAPKSATTWLYRCLREHPEIFLPERKEVTFLDYADIGQRLHEYEAYFRDAGEARVVGEISTRYLASPRVPPRAAALLPGLRVVVSLRNPIEQVYSYYWHLRRQNFHQWTRAAAPPTFEEALERFPERLLAQARYSEHLRRWFAHVDRARFCIVLYDDILADPRGVLAELYRHLGVDAEFVPGALEQRGAAERQGRSPRGPALDRIHAALYQRAVRGVYQPAKRALGVRRAERLKSALRLRETAERIFYRPGYPPLAPATRARLQGHFAGEVRRLAGLIGRDLGRWE